MEELKENLKFNLLNAELNPIYHVLALLGAHPILHVSRIRVKGQIIINLINNYDLLRISET
jgi:hypothetical protein